MAAFLAVLIWRSLRSAIKIKSLQRRNSAQGTTYKPNAKVSVGVNISVAIGAVFLLAMTIAAIFKSWPN
jgi:hypothetical protein